MPYDRYVAGVHDEIHVSLLECSAGGEGRADIDILDAEFFDDETLVLVYQAKDTEGKESTFWLYPIAELTRITRQMRSWSVR